jgi:AcrR family transcriptional regulator
MFWLFAVGSRIQPHAREVPAFSRLDPEGRRAQILEAARQVFSEQPYAAVSMAGVAQAAGVTRGLVHHYFGGKVELFRAVVALLAERAPALVATDLHLPIEELVASNVDRWLSFVEEHRELALAIGVGAVHPDDPELQALVDDTRDRVIERMIRNHTGANEAPPEVRLMLNAYLGLADSAAREWLYHGRATREQVQTLLVSALMALMRESLPALLALR